mmetsp:Transcript_534/g.1366  ORF Transcript_534/g.1366 Transcript_534/m.1366 type:complete len:384 (-) Transcript_534:25-1176(-)
MAHSSSWRDDEENRSSLSQQQHEQGDGPAHHQGGQFPNTPSLRDAAGFADAVGMLSKTVRSARLAQSEPRGVKRPSGFTPEPEPVELAHRSDSRTAKRERRASSACSLKISGVTTEVFKAKVAPAIRRTLLMLCSGLGSELALTIRAFVGKCGMVPKKWLRLFQHNTTELLNALCDYKCTFFGTVLADIGYTPNPARAQVEPVTGPNGTGSDIPTIPEQVHIVGRAVDILDRRMHAVEHAMRVITESTVSARRDARAARAEAADSRNRLGALSRIVQALETAIRSFDYKARAVDTAMLGMRKDVANLNEICKKGQDDTDMRKDVSELKKQVHRSIVGDIKQLKTFAAEMSEFANQVIDNQGKIADALNDDVFEAANGYTIKFE